VHPNIISGMGWSPESLFMRWIYLVPRSKARSSDLNAHSLLESQIPILNAQPRDKVSAGNRESRSKIRERPFRHSEKI
jgi:hypothetical protein